MNHESGDNSRLTGYSETIPVLRSRTAKYGIRRGRSGQILPNAAASPDFQNTAFSLFRLTAEEVKNLSALSGVAYQKFGAILPSLVAPNPAPKPVTGEKTASRQGVTGS